ncbi:MAG: hypothetical protein LBH92_08645 [Bacteroidales bacterium]|jgi:hypothetical protein|nr:hypothetical protein [Bacteroidales bacterium]
MGIKQENMGLKCDFFGHKWNHCKCERCGAISDVGHNWEGCKCSRCDKVRDKQHNWDLCKGKCSRCGKLQKEQHEFDGCKCSRCGKVEHNKIIIDRWSEFIWDSYEYGGHYDLYDQYKCSCDKVRGIDVQRLTRLGGPPSEYPCRGKRE